MLVGTLVNTAAVAAGSLIGLILGNVLPERLRDTVMKGLGLCTLFVGIDGMLGGSNALITIISVAIGAILGELLDLDGHLNRFADGLQRKFQKNTPEGGPSLGIGVMLSAAAIFVLEGSIACLASIVAPLLQQNASTIPEMTVVGSLLIVGISLNLLGVTKLKVMNYVPAIFLPILLCLFM